MAGGRKPGPQCSFSDRIDIDDGTICRAQSSPPGPLGPEFRKSEGGEILSDAFARAIQLAPAAVHREIGEALGPTLRAVVHDLIDALETLTAKTSRASTLSGFSDGLPETLIGGRKEILASLHLEFLPESLATGLGEMRCALEMGISLANNAAEQGMDGRDSEIEQAAEQLALAVGIFSWAILHGIVAYLLNNGDTALTPGSIAVEKGVRTQ